ncbi:hypothetical protein TGME49_226925 [Toxoplasma gondii ME49]|uniref:Uncharacterized protein n=2 Tax=Toxoplasma gondii TaxID=5811 RepID=S8GFH5_TOXGM|nr:hypothetical protein TGME49_226925 [Toxoplasma gondii ME49]EPT27189.1 hypothetical protein TGME49_226925 [Toxoplasma gondii ME49]KYF43341.1 hypothetical protein TGARI_226925 [Toxoplasma gondii ARI]|eukprot:XP_018636050.1 hypothetical protein TGME49_226925 [Toxoplasma gondii ME49]
MHNQFGKKTQLTFQLSWVIARRRKGLRTSVLACRETFSYGSALLHPSQTAPGSAVAEQISARTEAGTSPFEEFRKHKARRRFSTQTQQKGGSNKECQARQGMADASETASREEGQKEASFLRCHAAAVGVWLVLHALRKDALHPRDATGARRRHEETR